MHSSSVLALRSARPNLPRQVATLLGAIVTLGIAAHSAPAQESGNAAPLHLMPLPRSVQTGTGSLDLSTHFSAAISGQHDARLDAALDRMLWRLDRQCGGVRRSQLSSPAPANPLLSLQVAGPGAAVQGVDEDESYRLQVTATQATLTAATDVGAMHGMETFLQLVQMRDGACSVPAVSIDDAPRFPWRGLMVDVSRHFEPIDMVKRTIDGMVVAKLNVFHWHLSDDQGFRAESKRFPKLTEVASDGQYYTQDEMRDLVAYARARGIRVVPEFDIPGHTSSWLLAYPELGSGTEIQKLPTVFGIHRAALDPSNEKVYKFLDTFVGEMGEIFPDAYFHIGGDETKGEDWLANPRISAFMQKKGMKTSPELQAYFNQRLLAILKKHGKKMLGWDEILNPDLPKDIMVQSWRGEASLAQGASQGYTGILSAPYYLDAQKSSEMMFLADPVPADTKLTADQQKLILGGEVCMWAEQIHPETADSRIWPRTLAIAERFWSPQSDRDVPNMYRRLRIASLELEDVGLTHISGPEKLRRSLAESAHPEALNTFASVIEPVSFGERYHAQHTDALTSLDRLVDAVVADPPARQQIAAEVDAAVREPQSAESHLARIRLRHRFEQWQAAAPELIALAHQSARLSDTDVRARQLSQLATAGLEALAFLDLHSPAPADWHTAQSTLLTDAQKPSALVRFVFLPALQKLIDAASQAPATAAR